jgi:pyridoxal phosphate enzyme (YggS family)
MMSSIADNLRAVQARIDVLSRGRAVRLVAVSKTKPSSDVLEAYEAGHRHFAENYVPELLEKASQLPGDIQWHLVGHLQSNKVKKLLEVPNLYALETLDSADLADKLQHRLTLMHRAPLNVFIQVNTSGEDSKSGACPSNVLGLVQHLSQSCPLLALKGFMTIGETGSLLDFTRLAEVRATVAHSLDISEAVFELSMGMSADFEAAIEHGSTNVRVGSTIFGSRR